MAQLKKELSKEKYKIQSHNSELIKEDDDHYNILFTTVSLKCIPQVKDPGIVPLSHSGKCLLTFSHGVGISVAPRRHQKCRQMYEIRHKDLVFWPQPSMKLHNPSLLYELTWKYINIMLADFQEKFLKFSHQFSVSIIKL